MHNPNAKFPSWIIEPCTIRTELYLGSYKDFFVKTTAITIIQHLRPLYSNEDSRERRTSDFRCAITTVKKHTKIINLKFFYRSKLKTRCLTRISSSILHMYLSICSCQEGPPWRSVFLFARITAIHTFVAMTNWFRSRYVASKDLYTYQTSV